MATEQLARERLHPLLIALTFTTGIIDAACFLGLGVFCANVTGSVLLFGFGIAGAEGIDVLSPLIALLAFPAGAVAGGRLAVTLGENPRRFGIALTIELVLVIAATVIAAVSEVRPEHIHAYVLIAVIAFAMGLRLATLLRMNAVELPTTIVTITMARLMVDEPAAGGHSPMEGLRFAAIIALLVGAIIGALLFQVDLWLALAGAAVATAATLAAHVARDS